MSDKINTASVSPNTRNATKNTRRQALKHVVLGGSIITAGSMVPQKWARPIVDSVILPAHAATTDDSDNLPGGTPTTTRTPTVNYTFNGVPSNLRSSMDGQSRSFATRLLETAIPSAQAQAPTTYYICLAITGNSYTATVIINRFNSYFDEYANIQGTIDVTGTHIITAQHCADGSNSDISLLVENVTPNDCLCTINDIFNSTTPVFSALQGNCVEPDMSCDI